MGLPNTKSALPGSSLTTRNIGHQWLHPLWIFLDWLVSLLQVNSSSSWGPVRVATAAALPANTYSSETQTLTANANGALNNTGIDGVTTLAVGDRVLVQNEGTGSNDGIYAITALGATGSKWSMTRVADADASTDFVAGKLIATGPEGTANPSQIFMFVTRPFTLDTTTPVFTSVIGP